MVLVRGCLLAVLFVHAVYPQAIRERSRVEIPADERKAIEEARRGARPRPFVARKTSLGEMERERVKAFEAAKKTRKLLAMEIDMEFGGDKQ